MSHKVVESSWIPSLDEVACSTNARTNGSGCVKKNGVYVFDGWVFPAVTAGRTRSESVSLTPYEHNVDVAPVDFPRQENHP